MIKRIIIILILTIISIPASLAKTESGSVKYNDIMYQFSAGDETKFLQKAENYMFQYEKAKTEKEKKYYLNEAMRYYFLTSKVNNYSIDAQIGLGRVYDVLKEDTLAKKHFYTAYNMDNKNPKMNYYFGSFYGKRNDIITAIKHYQQAYLNGYANNYNLNLQLAKLYEKLADIESAKKFYKQAVKLNSSSIELLSKIRLLDDINYSSSQYYLYTK